MSPYLKKDDILSRMAAALRFTNLKNPDSVAKVLSIAGFCDEEIREYSQGATNLELLRRTAMQASGYDLENYEE